MAMYCKPNSELILRTCLEPSPAGLPCRALPGVDGSSHETLSQPSELIWLSWSSKKNLANVEIEVIRKVQDAKSYSHM